MSRVLTAHTNNILKKTHTYLSTAPNSEQNNENHLWVFTVLYFAF